MVDIQISQFLLHLIKIAVGNDCGNDIPSDIDWKDVIDLSFEQGVAAVAVDGLQRSFGSTGSPTENEGLGALDSPEMEDLKYEWFGEVFQAEEDYQRCQAAIAEFLKLCRRQQINVLLLKGYGLSLNYPIPSHRPCGDVDVFINDDDDPSLRQAQGKLDSGQAYLPGWKRINNLMRERGIEVSESNPHHSVFSFGGFTFENHITLLDVERHRNHFSDEQVFQKLIAEGCDEIEVEGERCFVPSVRLNSVYLLRHMAHHFAVEKITLRHILDWALFVRANASKIDWDFVYGFAKDSGCTPFLNCLNGICVESLGFVGEDFPVRKRDVKLQSRMLSDILHPEFDEKIPDTSRTLRYAIAKTRRILANRWKYRMVSDECLLTTIWNLAKKRLEVI